MLPVVSGILPDNSGGLKVALIRRCGGPFCGLDKVRRQHAGSSEQNARAPLFYRERNFAGTSCVTSAPRLEPTANTNSGGTPSCISMFDHICELKLK